MYSWPPEQHTPTWRLLVFISLTWNQRFLRGSYTSILLKGSPEAPRPPTQNNTPAKKQFSKIWSTMSLTLKKNQHRFMTMITLTMKFGGLVWWANSSVTGSYIWKMSRTEMLSCSILQCFHQISFKILQHPLPPKIKLKTTTIAATKYLRIKTNKLQQSWLCCRHKKVGHEERVSKHVIYVQRLVLIYIIWIMNRKYFWHTIIGWYRCTIFVRLVSIDILTSITFPRSGVFWDSNIGDQTCQWHLICFCLI